MNFGGQAKWNPVLVVDFSPSVVVFGVVIPLWVKKHELSDEVDSHGSFFIFYFSFLRSHSRWSPLGCRKLDGVCSSSTDLTIIPIFRYVKRCAWKSTSFFFFAKPAQGCMFEVYHSSTLWNCFFFALKSTKGIEQRQTFAGVPNCHGCQGGGRGNKASLAHWLEKVSNECTRTPKQKSVCIHVACHYFFSSCKAAKSDRAAGKQETPCDSAGCVKERGLMRSSPPVPPSKWCTSWCSEIGFLTSLMHAIQVHPVTSENHFHCTRLTDSGASPNFYDQKRRCWSPGRGSSDGADSFPTCLEKACFFTSGQAWRESCSGRLRHVQLPWTGEFGFWHFHSS